MANTAKASNIAKIDFVLDLLREGKVRHEILAALGKMWQTPERTADRLIKSAAERLLQEQQAAEQARLDQLTEETKQAAKDAILSEIEIDAILSQIVRGNLQVVDWISGIPTIRDVTPTEIINAADKLYKRKGSYAPIKNANTDKEGNDVAPAFTDAQIDKILDAITKG